MNASILLLATLTTFQSNQNPPAIAPSYSPLVECLATKGVVLRGNANIDASWVTKVVSADSSHLKLQNIDTLKPKNADAIVIIREYDILFSNIKSYKVHEVKQENVPSTIRIFLNTNISIVISKNGVVTSKDGNSMEIPAQNIENIRGIDAALKQSLRASNVNCPVILGQ